jgi:hypothetical protein
LLFVFEAIQLIGGTLVTMGLLVAAADWRRPLRSFVLVAIAIFVWLRPGIKPAGRPSGLYVAVFVGIAAALFWSSRSASVRAQLTRILDPRNSRSVGIAIALLIVLMAPAIVVPIASNWDVSGWMDSQSYDTFAINIVTGKAVEGSSGYMPFYQYGMAAVYYLFGHFFFVQQIVNAAFAVVGLIAFCLAAWTLFDRSLPATILAGLLYAYTRQFFLAVHFTQIEAWYVPLVCVVLLAWARYWRAPSGARAAWLAAAVGLALSTRNQGGVFLGFVCLAPALVAELDLRRRINHLVVVAALVAAILLPWMVRNIKVDGRWSPFADRSAMYIGILTDPRIGLYGIRYWEGWDEVARDYQARYPNKAERERAYLDAARRNVVSNPGRLARAVAWRTIAFYGLLPDGLTALDRIHPTDWREEWARYVFSRTTPLLLLPLSLVAIAVRPTRTNAYLAAAVGASLAILIVSASPEDRISYPVLPIHILMASSLFAGAAAQQRTATAVRIAPVRRETLAAAAAVAITLAIGARVVWGAPHSYRRLKGTDLIEPGMRMDAAAPLVNDGYAVAPPVEVGTRARARVMLSNYMYPPKFVGPVPFVPRFATDSGSPQYYFAYLISDGDAPLLGLPMGVTFAGAASNEPVREGDAAELEGIIEHSAPQSVTGYWMRVDKVRRLPIPRERMPVFP